MPNAVIVDAVRSPMGKGRAAKGERLGGALSGVHPVELLGQVLRQLVDRTGVDPALVDDVITGCVSQVGEQSGPVGRWAWLAAGLPEHVPSTAVHRACGSSQQALDFAAQAVISGAHDIVVASGVESMSRIPMFTARLDQDPFGPSVAERYAPGLVPQGVAAELVAARWQLGRAELDEYSARSHQLAAAADFGAELIAISVDSGETTTTVCTDETIRPQTTADTLSALPVVFETLEYSTRFPQISWSVTAGNSSQLADGAAAVMVMNEDRARSLGIRPLARITGFALAADNPVDMLTAPIPATEKLLKKTGLSITDIGHYEINEAFAPVPLAWRKHFDAPLERLNPCGGAIALGHPLGASGARLATTMLHRMLHSGERYGLQSMCEAGGMANATLIELV
jgi:acetyl-CoA acetyltransferase family protein